MPRHRAPVAVCILRVETGPGRALITMTVSRDIGAAADETVTRFVSAESAVAAVTEFLAASTDNKQALEVSSGPGGTSVMVTSG